MSWLQLRKDDSCYMWGVGTIWPLAPLLGKSSKVIIISVSFVAYEFFSPLVWLSNGFCAILCLSIVVDVWSCSFSQLLCCLHLIFFLFSDTNPQRCLCSRKHRPKCSAWPTKLQLTLKEKRPNLITDHSQPVVNAILLENFNRSYQCNQYSFWWKKKKCSRIR